MCVRHRAIRLNSITTLRAAQLVPHVRTRGATAPPPKPPYPTATTTSHHRPPAPAWTGQAWAPRAWSGCAVGGLQEVRVCHAVR